MMVWKKGIADAEEKGLRSWRREACLFVLLYGFNVRGMFLLVHVRAFYCTCSESLYVCTSIKYACSVAIVRRHPKDTNRTNAEGTTLLCSAKL